MHVRATPGYDVDGDGKLGPLEQAMKKYDTNKDGTFSQVDVREIVRDMEQAKKVRSCAQSWQYQCANPSTVRIGPLRSGRA